MGFTIMTHKGFGFDMTIDIEPIDFAAQLNNQELLTLPLAGMVLRKSNFKTIVPQGELTGAYELYTMDGGLYLTDIADYDNQVLSDYVNKSRSEFILIGKVIIQRHNFDMVRIAPTAE